MLGAILAGAAAIEKGAEVVGSIADGLKGNASDKKRIAAAQSALDKANAGDSSQLSYMIQQRWHSATSVGKEAFRRALVNYDARFSTNYASAPDPASGIIVAPTPIQSVVQQTTDNVKKDLATGAQQILTGTTNQITKAISPNAGTTVPLTQGQMYAIGAVVVLGIILLLRKHR